jgi:hypothetical protein
LKAIIMLNPLRIASRVAGACALALALLSPAQAAPVLSMSTQTTATGLDLTVSAQDVADLFAYQFTLNFDPALVAAISAIEGSFLPSGGATFFSPGDIDNNAGSVSFVFATLLWPVDGVDGSGDLVTFSFDVQQAGFAQFSLSDVLFLDSAGTDIAVDVRDVVAKVPEPATLALVALGLVAALGRRKVGATAA